MTLPAPTISSSAPPAARTARDRVPQHHKAVRPDPGALRGFLLGLRGVRACDHRRERRRQIDADEAARRRLSARLRRDPCSTAARCASAAPRAPARRASPPSSRNSRCSPISPSPRTCSSDASLGASASSIATAMRRRTRAGARSYRRRSRRRRRLRRSRHRRAASDRDRQGRGGRRAASSSTTSRQPRSTRRGVDKLVSA